MAHNCVIQFDRNEYGTYFTGQQLTGKVIIKLNKPKTFKGIKLQVNGCAQCQWREIHGRKKPIYHKNFKKRHTFVGHEDYIASTTYLLGSEVGQNATIDSGTHTYTFACSIPINCPSSYEGRFGHIRYTVKVTFIKSGLSNRTYTKGFTVLKLLDLNKESALLKSPASNESFERFCYFNGKAIHLRVNINQTGYVPGQMILVGCHVNNESKADVKKLVISLNLLATYTSETPCLRTVTEKICLVKKCCGPVAHESTKEITEVLRVPATTPTCDYLSKIVRISYEISVKAAVHHFMNNPKTVIPITIGNVPLISTTNERQTPAAALSDAPTTSACVQQCAEDNRRSSLHEDLNELPPPSYEEAIFMTADIADDDADTVSEAAQFTPRYPVYDVDNIALSSITAQSPPPNPPQKRRVRRKKKSEQAEEFNIKESSSRDYPIEI